MPSKSVFASKTMWFGFATTALGVLSQAGALPWASFGPWGGAVMAGIGVATIALRAVTTQPVTIGGS